MIQIKLNRNAFIAAMNYYDDAFSYDALNAMYEWLEFLQSGNSYLSQSTIEMLQQVRTLHIAMIETCDREEIEEIEAYGTADTIAKLDNGNTLFIEWSNLQWFKLLSYQLACVSSYD